MDQLQIVLLLFAIVLIAGFFYVRRARARDASVESTAEAPPHEPPADG